MTDKDGPQHPCDACGEANGGADEAMCADCTVVKRDAPAWVELPPIMADFGDGPVQARRFQCGEIGTILAHHTFAGRAGWHLAVTGLTLPTLEDVVAAKTHCCPGTVMAWFLVPGDEIDDTVHLYEVPTQQPKTSRLHIVGGN